MICWRRPGYDCPGYYEQNRKLVFESPEKNVRYLLVKPSDVAIYVEHQRCRCRYRWKGYPAREQGSDVYELLDLNIGKVQDGCSGAGRLCGRLRTGRCGSRRNT